MGLSLLAAPSLGGSDLLLPRETEARGPSEQHPLPREPLPHGDTKGYGHRLLPPAHLTYNPLIPPAQWVLDTPLCPGHPSQLLGCQHPNSPDLLQPSPMQPQGAAGAPSSPQPWWEPGAFKALPSTSSLIPH